MPEGEEEIKDEDLQPEQTSYIDYRGKWFTEHELQENPVDKVKLLKFLRDEQRICWLEIYLKIFAASHPPLKCKISKEYYTMSQAGMMFYHPGRSSYSFKTRRRHYDCCDTTFVFAEACEMENKEAMSGC